MRRHQFETYLDKVFDWTASVATMAEGRHNPPHPWSKVFAAVFLGSACQFGPVHRIEAECKKGVLEKRIGLLSEDTIGYALQRQSPEEVLDLGCLVARQLKRNAVPTAAAVRPAWKEPSSGRWTASWRSGCSTTTASRPLRW